MTFDISRIRLSLDETPLHSVERFSEAPPPLTPEEIAKLPPSVTLRGMSPVKDQGNGEFCASFATVALLEFKYQGKDLAECSLIRNAQQSVGAIMNYALQHGVCTEREWPYDLAHSGTAPCAPRGGGSQVGFSKTYLLYQEPRAALAQPSGARPGAGPKSDAIRRHLATIATPVEVEVPALFVNEGFTCGWEQGDVFYPKLLDRAKAIQWANQHNRWHAVAVHGYDDARQSFVFKNSWNATWGHAGYGTMSYLYVDELSPIGMGAQ